MSIKFLFLVHDLHDCCVDEIEKEIGLGTFGKVYKCNDRKYNDIVALKVIRGIRKYVDSAKIEARILDHVYERQKQEKVNFCVKLYSHFHLDGNTHKFQ